MKISVVMAVFNGAERLSDTLDSILAQTERDFELIVVDDGSTDATASILADYAARDGRVRILTQANCGLTRSLQRGCRAARANVIARHDAGDRSHPDRLARQFALLRGGVVLSTCAVRYVGPRAEVLYTARADGAGLRVSLLRDPAARIHGLPHHGSAMFQRDAYERAGGYRAEFRFAQDLDLWIRMAAIGEIAVAEEELYEATIHPRSMSSRSRREQIRLTEIMVAIRDGGDPQALLRQAARIGESRRSPRVTEAAGLYFIGRCLRRQRHPAWKRYIVSAIARNPFHLKAWLSLLQR